MLRGYRVQVKESRVRDESNMKLLILYGHVCLPVEFGEKSAKLRWNPTQTLGP